MAPVPRPRSGGSDIVKPRRVGPLAAFAGTALFLGGCLNGAPSPSASAPIDTPSVAPAGSLPEASASVAPTGSVAPAGTLGAGIYAKVIVDGLRVRIAAKADATPVGALFFGDVVRIRAAAGTVGGFTWYQVETVQTANDQPLLGYVAGAHGSDAYLQAMAGPPPPTPSHTPTPSPAPSASAAASAG
jgi:hypothetical protein